MNTLKESIQQQRAELENLLAGPVAALAAKCVEVWPDRDGLSQVLSDYLKVLPDAKFLYALDCDGVQLSDTAGREGLRPEHFKRDRSRRPYMSAVVPCVDFWLSEAYISLSAKRPSLTALQLVRKDSTVVGFVGVDFDLRDLPLTRAVYQEPDHWRQIKGDPAIRGQVFHQCRIDSPLDREIENVLAVVEALLVDHGVFQCKIHFSSSRATVFLMSDPYRYRILDYEALVNPDMCLAYPRAEYPADALVPAEAIRPILRVMRALRFIDETFYLRSGSVNIFNGVVSLTFSCDGSHYMRYDEFLGKGSEFWISSTLGTSVGNSI
ncbi:MAG: PDC sensor domain-containing protein [Thiotrichales bacterium]